MSGKITCCYKCAERHMGCHGSCERYLAEKTEHETERAKLCAAWQKQNDIDSYQKEKAGHLKRLARQEKKR